MENDQSRKAKIKMSQGQLFKDRFIVMRKTYRRDALVQKALLTLAEIWS